MPKINTIEKYLHILDKQTLDNNRRNLATVTHFNVIFNLSENKYVRYSKVIL